MYNRVIQAIAFAALLYVVFAQNFGRYLLEHWPAVLAGCLCVFVVRYVVFSRFEQSLKDKIVAVMGVIILGFCFYGFGSKFIELVRLVASDSVAAQEGIFAVAPLMNYLLASAGFLCLLGWATMHGMFRDIEQPKQTMLDVNAQLDSQTDDLEFCNSVLHKGGTVQ